jgi:lipopolysaccharide heptosyltransferase I
MTATPLPHHAARRIAIIKPSALGDIVHSLPVLSALRQHFPAAHLTWVVNRAYEPLLHGHPDLDATLAFERSPRGATTLEAVLRYGRFLSRLRQQRFDLVIDLQGLLRSGVMTLATGAARRVGLSSAREGAAWCYTDVVQVGTVRDLHAVDRYWRVTEALGITGAALRFRLPVAESARQWALRALADCPRPWLLFAVGARWLTKRWPPAHFAALARRAQARHGGCVVFVGAGEDAPLARATGLLIPGPQRDLTGATTLPQLTAALSLADAVVANDTGPLHLAVALGRPVVAPFTCTRVRLTGPYGHEPFAVETRVHCQGSLLRQCARLECMTELTPERLWPPLEEVLQRWETSRQSA